MEMSFTLEMDRPIKRGSHYICPGGYCLRFWLNNGKCKDIDFDFMDYEGTIENEKFLNCSVSCLDTESFPSANALFSYLKSYNHDWVEFFVYTGEGDVEEINPVRVTNITISSSKDSFTLKDYVFVNDEETALGDEKFNMLMSMMSSPLKFCKGCPEMSRESYIKFYERNGKVYLTTASGVGFHYDLQRGTVCSMHCTGVAETVKSVIMGVIGKLSSVVPFAVKSISVTCSQPTGAYMKKSTEELDTYDIILR